jgi:hypothetical protein
MKNQTVFGTLTVIGLDWSNVSRVIAKCSICGTEKSFLSNNLVVSRSRSCGSLSCIAKVRAEREAAKAQKAA